MVMSTLRENLNTLLQTQQVDSERDKLARLRAKLDNGEKLTQEVAAAQAEANKRRAELSQTSGSLRDAELELAALEKKISDYETKMRAGAVTNTREVMNFEKEFNQLNRQRSALDDKILTLMDSYETKSATTDSAEQKVSDLSRDLATLKAAFHNELTKIETQLGRLNANRAELTKLVTDPSLAKRYETLRARPGNGGIAIAHTNENTCGSCHMQIGTIAVSAASSGDQLVICENCGRIMA
jgi:predicted  nucleic acid-binding Zn-ribbon protein